MDSDLESLLRERMERLFPLTGDNNLLPEFLSALLRAVQQKLPGADVARIPGDFGPDTYRALVEKYSRIPVDCKDPLAATVELISELFSGVPRWRSPNLQYNVGAPVNVAATAAYAMAMDENVFNINDGHAGNVLVAEQAVANILAGWAGLQTKTYGIFTFGGTATNFYGTRLGIKKAAPHAGKTGIPKNLKMLIAWDGHFSHAVSADWQGLGTDNLVIVRPNLDRTSNLEDARKKLSEIFEQDNNLASIIINGGTFYGSVIDDIRAFAQLRDSFVEEFRLTYRPHIHVDSVSGWSWLVFSGYDFEKNELGIDPIVLAKIKEQHARIAQVKYADSWGVDFHKSIGGCPVDSSIVMINDIRDLIYLSKKEGAVIAVHQTAPEFSFNSPIDYTLETSRASGAALAALTSLHTLGQRGLQRNLARILESNLHFRSLLGDCDDMTMFNREHLGLITMIRLYPPELKSDIGRQSEFNVDTSESPDVRGFISAVNKYMKAFFAWDTKNRISQNDGFEYSFSTNFLELPGGSKLAGLKLYPMSPHYDLRYARGAAETLIRQKGNFDNAAWKGL